MFLDHVKNICQQVDPTKSLVYHANLTQDVNLLTLVKKKKNLITTDYEVMSITLGDLIPTFDDFSEFTERPVVKDYTFSGQSLVSAGIKGGVEVASVGVKGGAHSQQEASSVTIMSKTVELRKLKNKYCGQKINKNFMPKLRKGEVLGFVDMIIFNTADVTIGGKTGVDASCEASGNIMNGTISIFLRGKMRNDASFIVPARKTYAYTLNEITFHDEECEFTTKNLVLTIGGRGEKPQPSIPPPIKTSAVMTLAPKTFETDNSAENNCETLQQVKEELQRMEAVLQPLSLFPMASSHLPLSERLCQLSEDRDALTQLKRALDQWCEGEPFDQPLTRSVRTVLDQLRVATASQTVTGMTDSNLLLKAVYLLVSAMEKLPDNVPSMIAKCSPDILGCLNQLVSSIKERGQAHLTQPGLLQEGGELHWLTLFLCSTDNTLKELFELSIVVGEKPGVLLLALCVTVQGLSLMQV